MSIISDVFIITREDVAAALASDKATVETAEIVCAVSLWFGDMRERKPGERRLCLCCDQEFSVEQLPDAVMVIRTWGDERHLVSGICEPCHARPDLMTVTQERLRASFNADDDEMQFYVPTNEGKGGHA